MKIGIIIFSIGLCLGAAVTSGSFSWQGKLLLIAWGVYMVLTSAQDYEKKYVYRFYNYWGFGIGLLYMAVTRQLVMAAIMALTIYGLLQIVLFHKYMGMADGFAFVVSAMYLTQEASILGILLVFMLHMVLTMLLMLLCNLKSMNWKEGKLTTMQPMVPYISLTAALLKLLLG